MPDIPSINEIRETVREENERLAQSLAEAVKRAAADVQPGIFDRPFLPHLAAAAYLEISDRQLKKLRRAGLVETAFVDGRNYFYARADLDAYAAGEKGRLNESEE